MQISATTSATNAAYNLSIGGDTTQGAARQPPSLAPLTDVAESPDIQQLCRPSSVSLSPDYARTLADYSVYAASAQASAAALSQTMRVHDALVHYLGG